MTTILFKLQLPKYLLLLSLAATISCCNKDDDSPPTEPVDLLPPATQIGAGTFGCLLDGEVYVPDNLPNRTNCFYQFLNGEYFFTVRGSRGINGNEHTIAVKTENKEITQGESYDLFENQSGNAFGAYFFYPFYNYTTHTHTGKLIITKLDFDNHIVSGTFWFDVMDGNGVVHKIREGRFDVRYTE